MRRTLALITSAVVAAVSMQMVQASSAAAAAHCLVRPVFPSRISVNQTVLGIRVPIAISGPADCRANIVASTHLVHGTHDEFLGWFDSQPETMSVYASSIVPGTYQTTGENCSTYYSDFHEDLPCSMRSASTVIKFGSGVGLTAKRKGKRVTLRAWTVRYADYTGTAPTSTRVSLQRLSGKTWRTIKRATTRGKKGCSWTVSKRTKARYRVVAAENAVAFGATSRSVKR